eukprot:TRINITY_DN3258_c0_g1_i4.p1 TRINITY_DN3258_c0_g1~~TRINITY_DN3258_c0_g1_i4.p1  ORF type:complete len:338 (+),score=10.82 TRINITY_DN3258_c0_g1_i4:93-1106(+)
MGTNSSKKADEPPPMLGIHQVEVISNKWLLLGSGQVGKSTIFRHMRYTGYELQPQSLLKDLQNSTWMVMKRLVDEQSARLGRPIASILAEETKIVDMASDYDHEYTAEVGAVLHRLWQDPFIRQCYFRRHEFHLPDSAGYLLDRATQWADPNYTVTLQDILHIVKSTSGIITWTGELNGQKVAVTDVGGLKNERRKWPFAMEGTSMVLFVASLSQYDRVMYEDPSINQLQDSLDLFEFVAKHNQLENCRLVLIFNQMDLFRAKIQRCSLRDYFPDYDGPQQDADAAQAWLVQQFRNRLPSHRQIDDIFFTTATDLVDTQSNVSNMYARLLSLHQSQQ